MTPDRTQVVADLGCANRNNQLQEEGIIAHTVGTPCIPSLGIGSAVPLDTTGQLLHETNLQILEDVAALPNT